MFSYYGSKTNLIKYYPRPDRQKIIEPFAGAAKYSLKYFDREITLVEKYEVIARVWKWLQQCSEMDILKLPKSLPMGSSFDDINFDCIEARWFYSFISGCGDHSPRNKPTKRKTIDRPNHVNYQLKKISSQLYKIKHWKIIHGSFEDIENEEATWFIDPPYQHGGQHYKESSKKIDFENLSNWCKVRIGQVIVCENTKANWMDFQPLINQRGSLYSTTEAIWTNFEFIKKPQLKLEFI